MISPRSAAGVLESLIPLVVHERPERVLLLGIGGGDGLRAGLGFPVTRIDCVEPDAGRQQLVADHTEFDDPRLGWRYVAPALAVAADSAQYDVVIATSGRPVAWRAESTRTLEFYRNAARQLSGDGVFCQAFSVGDVGIAAVEVPHAAIRDVFTTTVRIQVGPGRFLIVATNSPRLFNRPGVVVPLWLRAAGTGPTCFSCRRAIRRGVVNPVTPITSATVGSRPGCPGQRWPAAPTWTRGLENIPRFHSRC